MSVTPDSRIRNVLATALLSTGCAIGAAADEIVLQPDRDNTLFQENGASSNGAGYLFAGSQGGGSVRRALLRFDVAGALPAGAHVELAELTVHVSRAAFPELLPASIHRLLAAWGEAGSNAGERAGAGAPAQPGDATWSHRFFSDQTWTTSGGDFAATASATALMGGIGDATFFSNPTLVADVQAWLDTPTQNHGWILRGDESQGGTARRVDSREAASPATHPALRIVYSPSTPVPLTWGLRGLLSLVLIGLGIRSARPSRV